MERTVAARTRTSGARATPRRSTIVRSLAVRTVSALREHWVRHPRWSLAAKGALAAALAWLVGLVAPAPFSEYPYYAPLGAVVATSTTAVRSVRESVQVVGALLLGAVIARGVDAVVASSVLSVALVVALALLCAGWRVFGEVGSWVVTSALFVLVIGGSDPLEYVTVYAGLVVTGAAIGVAVNLLLPALPLTPTELALDRLRDVLLDQVSLLALRLEREGPLLAQEWQQRRREVTPTIDRARDAVGSAREAVRANVRAPRYDAWTTAQARRADRLGTAADVVDDIVRLLAEWEREDRQDVALGPRLRPVLVAALRAYADGLRSDVAGGSGTPDDEDAAAARAAAARCDAAVGELAAAVREHRRTSGLDDFVAGAVVVTLWRGVSALAGAEAQG
ncbi:hypothetical protein ACFQHV_02945 [Promicromonospora thailandica]|uniref:hypothetical protein n=1 Tax=Promicromonospora thailandica TaxID=765201 RepID=UPI0020A53724|nr:hypothetical protein [Promicromonospora thailandica]